MVKSKSTPKSKPQHISKAPRCKLITFKADPDHVPFKGFGRKVKLSWTSEHCGGGDYKLLLVHPGIGETDVSSISPSELEVIVAKTTKFTLRAEMISPPEVVSEKSVTVTAEVPLVPMPNLPELEVATKGKGQKTRLKKI